ncbi:MAG TPA: ETX/MTX2 family pore-forming toxin [Acidimicrobiales bacterium]|nr:ETX/MTX2 family pore-forming toxin [Acidimicrobiales bacterium]
MTLQVLNVQTVSPYIANAWKRWLNTGEDPANGKWYTNGANNDGIGLYGGLNDALPTGLTFDESALTYLPKQIVASSAIVDNRNGLSPESTMNLSYTYSDTNSTSHTTTNSISVGAGVDVKGGVDFIVKGEVTVKFSINYTFSYSSTTSESKSNTQTFSQSLPIKVPTGKIYKGVLTATLQSIQVPYTANVIVKGTTETWFEDRINGHYNWSTDAGTMCGWINSYGTAGPDSALYRDLGGGQGALVVSGVLNAQQTANFQAAVYDITDSAQQDEKLATGSSPAALVAKNESPVPDGKLVETFKF